MIVGTPNVLKIDPFWGSMLAFCRHKGCYVGPEFTEEEEDENLMNRLSELKVDEDPEEEEMVDESIVQAMEDPAWRGEL